MDGADGVDGGDVATQAVVGDEQVDVAGVGDGHDDGLVGGGGAEDVVAPDAEHAAHGGEHLLVVVDDEHAQARDRLGVGALLHGGGDALIWELRLVLFSADPASRGHYQALFRERAVHKVYEAIAPHRPEFNWPLTRRSRIDEDSGSFFRMVESAGEPNSETHIELCEVRGDWARYRLSPLTGKRHQLRVHMNALGAPIVGDQFYPTVLRGPDDAEDFAEPLRLLARSIAFDDPVTGLPRTFESQRAIDWPPA